MKFLIKILLTGLFVAVLSNYMPGIYVQGLLTSVIVALVLSFLNAFVKPLFILLTLPVTILTLGLFLLVINGLMVLLCAEIVPGFRVDSFWHALLFSLFISAFHYLLFDSALIRQNK